MLGAFRLLVAASLKGDPGGSLDGGGGGRDGEGAEAAPSPPEPGGGGPPVVVEVAIASNPNGLALGGGEWCQRRLWPPGSGIVCLLRGGGRS